MNILRIRGLQLAIVVVLLTVTAVIAAAFFLDGYLADAVHMRNITGIIQAFVTVVAIVLAAILAQNRFQLFRAFQPHLSIDHRISHRRISDNHTHIEVTAILNNRSRVQTEIHEASIVLQRVGPISDQKAEALIAQSIGQGGKANIQWDSMARIWREWTRRELVIEPGETHSETFEFIVRGQGPGSILIYTYFYNPQSDKDPSSAGGWAATTVYDIMASSELGTS